MSLLIVVLGIWLACGVVSVVLMVRWIFGFQEYLSVGDVVMLGVCVAYGPIGLAMVLPYVLEDTRFAFWDRPLIRRRERP